jgi:hypothetical protein
MKFIVLELFGNETVIPPFGMERADGNSVEIINHLRKPLTVTHSGHLTCEDPFTVPARGSGRPPSVTCDIAPQSDTPGTVFQIHVEASRVPAFGSPGDPTIIIL